MLHFEEEDNNEDFFDKEFAAKDGEANSLQKAGSVERLRKSYPPKKRKQVTSDNSLLQ